MHAECTSFPTRRSSDLGAGALYGTTVGGGTPDRSGNGFGTVFKLSPPAAGMDQWQETVLYRFAGGSDGRNPIDRKSTRLNSSHLGIPYAVLCLKKKRSL